MEYDLTTSSLATGVVCVKSITPGSATVCSHRIEPAARPTAIMWHPKLNGDFEDRCGVTHANNYLCLLSQFIHVSNAFSEFIHALRTLRFVTANDVFKFKEFNLDSKQCRRTSLAPRFGNPVTALLPIPPDPTIAGAGVEALEVSAPAAPQSEYDPAPPQKQQLEGFGNEVDPSLLPDGQEQDQQPQASVTPGAAVSEYFVFATNTRVIGLSSFPLTGDPSEVKKTVKNIYVGSVLYYLP